MKDENASGPIRCRQSWRGVAPQCCLTEGHEGPCRYKCASARCPGLLLPASESAHPASCLFAPVLQDDELYITDNGAVYCGKHCGVAARYTGKDISGQKVERLSAGDANNAGLSCEQCACLNRQEGTPL